MIAATTSYEHIVLDENSVPTIGAANTKVVELVLETLAHGSSPEELHFQFPHLSLGQIYSALAYYWDHKEEIDSDVERRFERVEQWRREGSSSAVVERLRKRGLL